MKNVPESAPDRGIYALLLRLKEGGRIRVGKLGSFLFPAGYYVYVGRAAKGLAARLRRHGGRRKNLFWHIDYLLRRAVLSGYRVYPMRDGSDECRLASRVASLPGASVPAERFGASDCGCRSHLFRFRKRPLLPLLGLLLLLPAAAPRAGNDFLDRWDRTYMSAGTFDRGKDPHGAIRELRDALTMGAPESDVFYRLGVCYERAGDAREALRCFQEALRRMEGDAGGSSLRPLLEGRVAELEKRGVTSEPGKGESSFASKRVARGKDFFNAGKLAEARREYHEALRASPEDPDVLYGLGLLYEYAGGVRYGPGFPARRCERYYRRAIELRPGFGEARYNLAKVYEMTGEPERAEREYLSLLEETPEFARAHFALSQLYGLVLGDAEKAERHFNLFLEKEKSGDPRYNGGDGAPEAP